MHMIRHQMALDNLTLLLPGQRVEDRTQLPACLPENGLSAPFGHKNYVVLAVNRPIGFETLQGSDVKFVILSFG
jgi:hypothetical protein